MAEQYTDISMSLSSSYHYLGDGMLGLKYTRAHFKQRILVEDSKPPLERDDVFRAMACIELSLRWLLNNNYEAAIAYALQGRQLLQETKEFVEDVYWPHWADYHHAWALIGLNRAVEARPILTEMLKWRQRHYGDNDVESMKTAYALQILGVVNEKAGRFDEAIEIWERALVLYCRTEGDSSFRTNQVRVKLGEYYGRLGKPETSIQLFDTALKYFVGDKYYKAERARTLFKKSQFLASMDDLLNKK
ncbi:hypothetical protein HYFRA_00014029 [Hymenoscyphus fraxineus]|uniref:Tetratricopeptide repeat protein n=1 Tax=Hymenoscyphus fraxineus TaxID=746836 RepID=A0A9N9PPH1_9HELO|nr:hypothetical protein HYFRA_00014029 [Hymenoscyphus fraxineus]